MFAIEINPACSVPVNLEPHNIRFHSAHRHQMLLRIIHAPTKTILAYLTGTNGGDVELSGVFVRCCVHYQGHVSMAAVIRYRTRTATAKQDAVARYIVSEREIVLPIASDSDQERREWLIRTMDGYFWRYQEGNTSAGYAALERHYKDWAHPSFDSIAARLTDAQKAEAIAMICQRFHL